MRRPYSRSLGAIAEILRVNPRESPAPCRKSAKTGGVAKKAASPVQTR